MAYEIAIFIVAAAIDIISIALIYTFKDVLHSVVALAFAFIINSAFFMMLGQPFLALIQLFIMVGGVATYAFVGVSSAGYSKFRHTDRRIFMAAYVVLFILLAYAMLRSSSITALQTVPSLPLNQILTQNVALLYLIAIVLFGVAFGSIIMMKKMRETK
jgi:NADH:ubiquinone oxidoreductase subunit 6 (subunit J)